MILQRDARLRAELQQSGCYLMSLLFLGNMLTNIPLSAELITNEIYPTLLSNGWIDTECTVMNPAAILGYFGVDVQFLGRAAPDRSCAADEVEILQFVHGARMHFVVGDGRGHVAYDPWGRSTTVREGHLVSKRIFKIQTVRG